MSRPNEYHWVFGDNVHLHFASGGDPILVPPPTGMTTNEGCASISDRTGNLLFYSDGDELHTPPSNTNASGLGGHASATHSAIIVPPAGGGSEYHLLTTGFFRGSVPVHHHRVQANGTITASNTALTPFENSERLAATSQEECEKYWVATQDRNSMEFYVYQIDGDSTPHSPVVSPSDGTLNAANTYDPRGQLKFSPDGKWLAIAYYHHPTDSEFGGATPQVSLYRFNSATGVLTRQYEITEIERAWGVEFSPDSQIFYFTENAFSQKSTRIYGVPISALSAVTPLTDPNIKIVHKQNTNGTDNVYSALQLGPNDKIYSTVYNRPHYAEIGDPNNLGSPNFQAIALDKNSVPIKFHSDNISSIPTFTRLADRCVMKPPHDDGDCCESEILEVNEELAHEAADNPNVLKTCDGEKPRRWECHDVELPQDEPHVSISWGASKCDCLESDDVEIMSITICNPYRNVTLSNLVIPRMRVLMKDGSAVPTLPDGTPSVRIIPRGPICFGDIEGCECVTREFVMENRGAKSGSANPYKIEIEEFCYQVSYCNEGKACFEFVICKDN